MPVGPPRRHCRHDDWLETYWTGLIDRLARGQTQAALCVEPEINAMSIVGFVTATESVFEFIQQDLNRCSLRSRRRTAWWEFSARLFCALCQGALFSR
jgi:hypothetical protein